MADAAGPPGIPLIQAVLTFSGALLAPIIGTIASLLSRSDLQRRQQETEYKMARFALLEKAITLGNALSDISKKRIDLSVAESEFLRLLSSLSEPAPPSPLDTLPFERRPFLIRIFMVPRPHSISGWIASSAFYIFLLYSFIGLMYPYISLQSGIPLDIFESSIVMLGFLVMLLISFLARRWAIRSAKAAIRRARDQFERETGSLTDNTLAQKS
jgi:hypothetical protein